MRKLITIAIICSIISVISVALPVDLAKLHNYIFTSIVPLMTVIISLLVYVNTKGETKKIALAVLLFSFFSWLAEITWNYYEIIGLNPFPSLADVFYVSAYFPLIYILMKVLQDRLKYMDLKCLIFSAVFTAFTVVFIIVPSVSDAFEGMTFIPAFVSVLYIILDVILISLLIPLIVLYIKKPVNFLYGSVILASALMFIGDILFNFYESWGIYYTGSLPDVFYNLEYSVLLVAMYAIYKKDVVIVTFEDIVKEKEKVKMLNRIMRHDILNAITVAMNYIELYMDVKDDSLLKKALDSMKNIENLIKSIRAVESHTELKPINLKEVVEREIRGYQAKIVVSIPNVKVLADDLISSVFRNLIINAITYSKNPVIEISAKTLNGWVEVRVADNGVGIPDDEKERVFDMGYGKHTGMGLYLVKTIIESYGGKVWVEDNKPRGSVFVLRLKKANGK